MNEIQALSESNTKLSEQVADLSAQLEATAKEAELGQSVIQERQSMFTEMETHISSLENERDLLQDKVVELTDQLVKANETQDKMWQQFNKKLEEWKLAVEERDKLLREKDEKLLQYSTELSALKQDEGNMDTYEETFEGMKKAIFDRDNKIMALRAHLVELEATIKSVSAELDSKKRFVDQEVSDALRGQRKLVEKLQQESETKSKTLEEERAKYNLQSKDLEEIQEERTNLQVVISQYERGYGTEEIAKELRLERKQLHLREQEIEKLSKEITQREAQIGRLYDENRAIRMQHNIPMDEAIDIAELQLKDRLELEQLKAVTAQYEQEIQELEEERLRLKAAVRMDALNQGERAIKLGLSSQGLRALENYAKRLKEGKEIPLEDRSNVDLRREINRLNSELEKTKKALSLSQLKMEELTERKYSVHGKTRPEIQSATESPAVQELIAEVKRLTAELSQRDEQLKLFSVQDTALLLSQQHQLPSKENAMLAQYLVEALEEITCKEKEIQLLVNELQQYKQQAEAIIQQQQLLYSEFQLYKEQSEEKIKRSDAATADIKEKYERNLIQFTSLQGNLDIIASGNTDEVKKKLAADATELALLRVNNALCEKKQSRLEEENSFVFKELKKVKEESMAVEMATKQRIVYLEEVREQYSNRLETLQTFLDSSVPATEHYSLLKKFELLSDKYKDILDREKNMISQFLAKNRMVQEAHQSLQQLDALRAELEEEKIKGNRLEAALLERQFKPELSALTNRIIGLEISEANAKKKAEMANKKWNILLESQKETEDHVSILENENIQLIAAKHQLQEEKLMLQSQLQGCVTREQSNEMHTKIIQLQEECSNLQTEVIKYKELYQIAFQQTLSIHEHSENVNSEVYSLQETVRELQSLSDANDVIGRLHRQLILVQVNETTTIRKLEQTQSELTIVYSKLYKQEKKLDQIIKVTLQVKEQYRLKVIQHIAIS